MRFVPQAFIESPPGRDQWPRRNQVPQMRHTYSIEARGDKPKEPFSERPGHTGLERLI